MPVQTMGHGQSIKMQIFLYLYALSFYFDAGVKLVWLVCRVVVTVL
jgi:hypothetical protein